MSEPSLCEYRSLATRVVWWVNGRNHLQIRVVDDNGVWCCGAEVRPAPASRWDTMQEVYYTAQHHPGLPVVQLEQAPAKLRRLNYRAAEKRLAEVSP